MTKEGNEGRVREIERKAQILHNFSGLQISNILQMKDSTGHEHSWEKIMNVRLRQNYM